MSVALTKMKLRAFTNVALDAGGKWAVDFPAYAGLTLNVVQKGGCCVFVLGDACVGLTPAGLELRFAEWRMWGHKWRLRYGFCWTCNPTDHDSTVEPSQPSSEWRRLWHSVGILADMIRPEQVPAHDQSRAVSSVRQG